MYSLSPSLPLRSANGTYLSDLQEQQGGDASMQVSVDSSSHEVRTLTMQGSPNLTMHSEPAEFQLSALSAVAYSYKWRGIVMFQLSTVTCRVHRHQYLSSNSHPWAIMSRQHI